MSDKRIVLIDRDRIKDRVHEMGRELSGKFGNQGVIVIGVLGGAFIFMADLIRQANFASSIDFIWLESYDGTKSTGEISIRQDIHVDVRGQKVLIVDDILDTGLTLRFTRDHLMKMGAASVDAAVLLRKNREDADPTLAEFVGFLIEDKFVVGYGLDYNGRYRHLPDICRYSSTPDEPK